MNNIDINNNFINQLKEKYKIIIGIVLFIFLLVIIIQVYFFYNNKKILDTSIVYSQIKSDLEKAAIENWVIYSKQHCYYFFKKAGNFENFKNMLFSIIESLLFT